VAVVLSDASESEIDTGSLASTLSCCVAAWVGLFWITLATAWIRILRHKKDQESMMADEPERC
jgi:hypothetical protein